MKNIIPSLSMSRAALYFYLFAMVMNIAHGHERIQIVATHYEQHSDMLKFEIKGNIPTDRVVLDCQSFIHGVTFYQFDHPRHPAPYYHFMLYEPECHEIHHFFVKELIKKSAKQACLTLYPNSGHYEIDPC